MKNAHLDSDFRQVNLHGQLFAAVHVRVVRLLERPLQLVQLIRGERGTVPPVLLLVGWRHASGCGRGRRARPAARHVLVVRFAVTAVSGAVVHVAGPTLRRPVTAAASAAAITAADADVHATALQ